MTRAVKQTPAARSRCTCFVLRKLTRRVTQIYDRMLAEGGLTITQYSLLAHLDRQPGRSISALAESMGMDRTSLVRTLRRVIDAGWARHGAKGAGHAAEMALTAEGEAKLNAAKPLWQRAQGELNALLGTRRIAELHALADQSLDALRPRKTA